MSCIVSHSTIDNVNIYDTFETETETVDHIAECNTIINIESVQLATVSHTKQIHPPPCCLISSSQGEGNIDQALSKQIRCCWTNDHT